MKYKEESQFYSHQARKRHAVLVEIKTELEKDIDAAQLAFEQKKVHEICEFQAKLEALERFKRRFDQIVIKHGDESLVRLMYRYEEQLA